MSTEESRAPRIDPGSGALRSMAPQVIDTGGRLIPFWDHSVLFIANLLALFFGNQQQTQLLENEIRGADTYGGRLLPILNLLYRGDQNVLVLERAPDPSMQRYFTEQLGLTLPRIDTLSPADYQNLHGASDRILERFGSLDVQAVDGYVTDDTLSSLALALDLPTVSSVQGSRRGNNKALLHDAMVAAGLPMLETLRAVEAKDVPACVEHFRRQGYRSVVIKSPLGASGIGIMKVGATAAYEVPDMIFFEGPCMVQGWLEPGVNGVVSITSPSVQMFLNHQQVVLYDMTKQILSDDSVHQGNESPPVDLEALPDVRAEMMRQAGIAGQWLHGQGYRGTASVDFLVVHDESTPAPSVYICEINARVTGATYPSVLARHFRPEGAWLMRNVTMNKPVTGRELLEKLDFSGHLFVADAPSGVLPINLNLGESDVVLKGQFLCLADTVAACHEMLSQVELRLGVPWTFDRD